MRIALLEMYAGDPMSTGERCRALVRFLAAKGHEVDVLAPSPERLNDFHRFRFSVWSRLKRRALGRRRLPHLWDYVADEMEPRVRSGGYDVVMARLQPVAYTLTRLDGCLRIFDCANIGFLESYHGWNADMSEIEIEYEKEMAIFRSADHVFLHHEILTRFFRTHVFDDDKVRTVRMGCYPATRTASFSRAPRIVYAGSYEYIQDPYLLSLLTKASPYPIECYGKKDPNYPFLPARLAYKGYAPEMSFLADYHVGLITVSRDRLRRHSPSTKFAYYFAHGLPVLFPEWMKEGYTYEAAVPYTEENFVEQARSVCESEDTWRRLSEAAIAIGRELDWEKTLAPLEQLLQAERETTTARRRG
jgi:hypothetical protein